MDTPNNHGTRISQYLTHKQWKDKQLLTDVQSDHQERIMVAEPFTCIQCEMLLSKSGRGRNPMQGNCLHETLHVGKSNIILRGILLGHHKPNFLHWKTFLETLLKLDNYPEPYHTITFPDFGFRTVNFYQHLIPTNFLASSKRTSLKGKDKIVSAINYAFKTYEGMNVWRHPFLTLTP
jgi:hypothetical protein